MARTSVQRAELGKSEAKERDEECGGIVQEFYEVIVRHGVVNPGKRDPGCLERIRRPLRSPEVTARNRWHYLGHEDVLSTEAVVRTGVVVIDGRNGEVCVLSQKVHGRYFRFGLDPGHAPPSNPRDEFKAIDESNQISLGGGERRA